MKKLLLTTIGILFIATTAYAKPISPVLSVRSGQTIAPGTGVSLVGVINNVKDDISGYYSIEVGTITFPDNSDSGTSVDADAASGLTNANPNGTGIAGDSSVTFVLRYALSNKPLTTAQWEAKGTSGTTPITTLTLGSGTSDEPLRFRPAPSTFIGILFNSGMSQFLVPKAFQFAR